MARAQRSPQVLILYLIMPSYLQPIEALSSTERFWEAALRAASQNLSGV
ncbi:hypothetical protein HCU40_10155 [Pseudanabaena biceps]|nr:hypothetical protein [Pseudanabaena biceps]